MRFARFVVLVLAFASLASPAAEESGAAAPERDDPRGRQQARALLDGPRSIEAELAKLRAAHDEARRYGIGRGTKSSAATTRVPGSAWINLGPSSGHHTTTPIEIHVDSGRAQKIVPHPTDPNVLYYATSGGGVWKTFNAQASIDEVNGPTWFPITEGVGSLSIGAFALDPTSPENLFLGLGDTFDVQTPGFLTSNDGGATWSDPVLLQSNFGGKGSPATATSVRDIVVAPDNSKVVMVATDVGLFVSAEAGIAASFLGVDLTLTHQRLDVWSIAWTGANNWVVTTCNAAGGSCSGGDIWHSKDNGHTWDRTTAGLPQSAQSDVSRMTLAAATTDPVSGPGATRVYLLASNGNNDDQKDVFLSNNGGLTWISLNMLGSTACLSSSSPCAKPSNPNADQPDLDVLHDQSWYNQAIVVDPRNKNVLFVGGNLSLVRSVDGGQNWDVVANWLPGLGGIDPQSGYLPYVHADWHAMAISTLGAHVIFYGGTDGGLFQSIDFPYSANCVNNDTCSVFTAPAGSSSNLGAGDHSPSFDDRVNRGIVTHLAYSIASDEHDVTNPILLGGLQDNGTRLRSAGGNVDPLKAVPTSFNQVMAGDGFGVGIGISNDTYTPASCGGQWGSLLVGTLYAALYRSIDCGQSFAVAMSGICKQPNHIATGSGGPCNVDYGSNFFMKAASAMSDANGHTFATVINNSSCSPTVNQCTPTSGFNNVFVTKNGAVSWANATGTIHLSDGGTATHFPDQLRFVGINPKSALQIGVTDSSNAYFTLDGGVNWTQSPLPSGPVSSVAFDPNDGSGKTLWASTRNGARPVYQTIDSGAHWTLKAGSGTGALPSGVPGNDVRVDPNDPLTIYLGTEIGLYRSIDGGSSWARYGTGLPLVSVTEINVSLDSTAVRVSTFGRGFWELWATSGSLAGVFGNGDFDHSQIIDGIDIIREAALLGTTPVDADYDSTGNLSGTVNGIDDQDMAALIVKFGGRP